jgi:aryl-phospho-beta-D-glucosidase BglC (GH1 family)
MTNKFLHVRGREIIDGRGRVVFLRGVNFGGWLMKEAYILHAPNFAEQKMKRSFIKSLGPRQWQDFDRGFKDNFISKRDLAEVGRLGLNCVRVPFHHGLIEKTPYRYDRQGVQYLDRILDWAEESRIYVILDLHAAAGSQNHDWHSDSLGRADFWRGPVRRKRACRLWEFLAGRYAAREYLAGYDLLNEAVVDDAGLLNEYYHDAIAAIRRHDPNHILFIEGNRWATDIECLDCFDDGNYVLSLHTYEPLDLTFNFVPSRKYPSGKKEERYGPDNLRAHLRPYLETARRRGVPLYVGEFGVNYRGDASGELRWLEDNLSLFKEHGLHWTYWTFKAVKNFMFPDGVFSYYPNPPWVNRPGPLSGWDTYCAHWPRHHEAMAESWRTESFECNRPVARLLKTYAS